MFMNEAKKIKQRVTVNQDGGFSEESVHSPVVGRLGSRSPAVSLTDFYLLSPFATCPELNPEDLVRLISEQNTGSWGGRGDRL